MKKLNKGSISSRVSRFLLKYRTTPHPTTGKSLDMLLCRRKLKTHPDLLQPDESAKVRRAQTTQKLWHDTHSKGREFSIGDTVFAYNFRSGVRWLNGIVIVNEGSSFIIKLLDGCTIRRHADHLRKSVLDFSADIKLNSHSGSEIVSSDIPFIPTITQIGVPKKITDSIIPKSSDLGN
ncbi:uncharacterized protein LOC144344203 [Saccoglossus kowalevskii]